MELYTAAELPAFLDAGTHFGRKCQNEVFISSGWHFTHLKEVI